VLNSDESGQSIVNQVAVPLSPLSFFKKILTTWSINSQPGGCPAFNPLSPLSRFPHIVNLILGVYFSEEAQCPRD